MSQNPQHPVADRLAALDKSFGVFLDAARAFPIDRVREKPSDRAFSATEIVYHMLDVERLWQRRMRGLPDHSSNYFEQMDADKEAHENRYNEKSYVGGLDALEHARRETQSLVQSMKPEELELCGIHATYGEMNILRMLTTIEAHDRTHAAQLQRTVRELDSRSSSTGRTGH